MRKQASAAWLELGYDAPDNKALNAEQQAARSKDRAEHERKKAERAALPVRRVVAKEWFAQMHAAVHAAAVES